MPSVDGALDQLNVATQRHIRRSPILVDGIFNNDPFLAYLKKNCVVPFSGGRVMAENFIYDTLLGGAYHPGAEFDISEVPTDQQAQWLPRFLHTNVTMSDEDIEVFNKGENAVYRLIDSKMANAYRTIGSHLAISLYLRNNATGYGALITGLAEALGYDADSALTSWDGTRYTKYAGLTRADYNGALTSNIRDLSGAAIEYEDLSQAISDASWGVGEYEPNLIVTTPNGLVSMKNRFQAQQRFNEVEPIIGFKGLSVENCVVLKSRYCPGQDIATSGTKSNRVATRFLEHTVGSGTTYPSVSNEVAFVMNARKPHASLYISTSKKYGFGFTGFKVAQGNTKLAGQVLWSGQLTLNPSYHTLIKNFI